MFHIFNPTGIALTAFLSSIQNLGYPMLRTIACVGGTAIKDQLETIKRYKIKCLIK